MSGWSQFFFVLYPYICISIMLLALAFRYVYRPGEWNARSSEIFERKSLRIGSLIFHYAILFSFFGHVFGLLTPDALMRALHIPTAVHLEVALVAGQIFAPLVIIGLAILLWRRLSNRKVYATTLPTDLIIIALILLNAFTGMYQAYVAHFSVFTTIGPWLRSLIIFQPEPALMLTVPAFMQVHVVSAFTLFALLPFSRLVHIFSVPVTYTLRPFIVYRRRYDGL